MPGCPVLFLERQARPDKGTRAEMGPDLTQIQVRAEEVAAELGVLAWLEIWAAMAALDYPQPLQVQPFGLRVAEVEEP